MIIINNNNNNNNNNKSCGEGDNQKRKCAILGMPPLSKI